MMKSAMVRSVLALCCAASLNSCTTSKADVREEWDDVEKERAEAVRETEKYAARQKSDFEDHMASRLDKSENELANLRTDTVKAVGKDKITMEEAATKAQEDIDIARADLKTLKGQDARSWENDRKKLEDRVVDVENKIASGRSLAH